MVLFNIKATEDETFDKKKFEVLFKNEKENVEEQWFIENLNINVNAESEEKNPDAKGQTA